MNESSDALVSPGERLRREREVRALSLHQAAEALHVEPRLLEALEQDRFAEFDAPVYAKGYLRKYAVYLGVPADVVIGAYDRLRDAPAAPTLIPAATARDGQGDYREWRLPLLAAAMVVAIGGSFWWWFAAREAMPLPGAAAPVLSGRASTDTAASLPTMLSVAESAVPTAVERATHSASVAAALPASAPGTAAAHEPVTAAAAGSAAGFTLYFGADCWTEVYDGHGERLHYDLVGKGETRAFAGRGPWRVFLGRADAARLRVGGQSVAIPVTARRNETARFILAGDGTVR